MSLVSTWVQAQDGQWYRDPVIREVQWFVCWDDDDPIELVVQKSCPLSVDEIVEELNQRGWKVRRWGKVQSSGSRLFPRHPGGKKVFVPSVRAFLLQNNGPPADLLTGNAPHGLTPGMGVLYHNGRRTRGC